MHRFFTYLQAIQVLVLLCTLQCTECAASRGVMSTISLLFSYIGVAAMPVIITMDCASCHSYLLLQQTSLLYSRWHHTFRYHWLPFGIFGYLSVSLVTFRSLLLPFAIFGYLSLSFVTFRYLWLPFAIFGYLSLSFVTFRYLLLPFTIFFHYLCVYARVCVLLQLFCVCACCCCCSSSVCTRACAYCCNCCCCSSSVCTRACAYCCNCCSVCVRVAVSLCRVCE